MTRPQSKRWFRFLVDVALSMFFGVMLGVLVVFYLIGRHPPGYIESVRWDAAASTSLKEKLSAISKDIRSGDPVVQTFTEEEITSFLTAHKNPDLWGEAPVLFREFAEKIPAKVENLQVHISPDAFRLDCRYAEAWLRHPVVSAYIKVELIDGMLQVHNIDVYAGKLPIKEALLKKMVAGLKLGEHYYIEKFEQGQGEVKVVFSKKK